MIKTIEQANKCQQRRFLKGKKGLAGAVKRFIARGNASARSFMTITHFEAPKPAAANEQPVQAMAA